MKYKSLSVLAGTLLFGTQLQAEETVDLTAKYSEPTRGFLIEHALTNATGNASLELHGGSDVDSGAGVRLGLPGAELVISQRPASDYDINELQLKWSLDAAMGDENQNLSWAIIGGLAHYDYEHDDTNTEAEKTNVKLGIAVTAEADAGVFTLAPKLVVADNDNGLDDTFFELDAGAYLGLVDTKAGLFSVGVEGVITTADDVDNTFLLGMRWLYNEHLTVDFVPFMKGEHELTGLPGLVRLNASF